ncbi:IS1 family transposase [bacterium]|nr:IS1 family transposase [bacterium]
MHNQIDKLKYGDERACDDCGKIFESSRFPYKSVNLCLWCYEKQHGIRLKTLRNKLRIPSFQSKIKSRKLTIDSNNKPNFCPNCYSDKIRKARLSQNKHNKYLCRECNNIWDSEIKQDNTELNKSRNISPDSKCPVCNSLNYEKKGFRNGKQRYICKDCGRNWTSGVYVESVKKKNNFKSESTLEEILNYLKKREKNNMPLKFWYRDDIKPREVYDYFIDDKYIQVKSGKGYYIKFLIDKIRKI